ncbi:type II secretion system GspH family protein [Caldibacillus thermoamylovorans]|uniref:type II secretion system protein n=1 Tax=Caldibacillus thermoamylovorans TaxID=35841 RepID=UPI0020403E9E|nr:type II secretion system protein [Caldibacillus thermoamylovorans]MCM3798964.1 type II secretion system GspH family protein [Caldibacillus thermoamylovorans]
MQKRMKLLKNQKGMTLVELLAVLVILGIIAAIAIPMIGNVIQDSKERAILADAQSILSGAKIAQANGVKEFTKDNIKAYVEGIDSDADYSVSYDSTTGWSVTYSKLGVIKEANRTKYGITKARGKYTITATNLSKALKGE